MKFHSGLIVKIQAGNSDVEIGSTCGVKQGCTMAPILFLIYMQAAVEVFNVTSKHCKLQFKTREDNVFSGRNIRVRKDVVSFEIASSLYADDGASYSNLDLTCIKEWSSSFALSKGLASSAMWDAEEPNRRQKQCIFRPPNN